MVEHGLRVLVSDRGLRHPEVAEHGFGAPATKQLDGTGVDSCAEQGGGPAGAEAMHRYEGGIDASSLLEIPSGIA